MNSKIPIRVRITGSTLIGKKYVGFAETQCLILEKQMRHRGLAQGSRTVQPADSVVVKCVSQFSLREVHIHVFSPGERGEFDTLYEKECFCGCLFAYGIVQGVTVQDPVATYGDVDVRFDILVCNMKEDFLEFKHCVPTDFARYVEGDEVIVYYRSFVEATCCPTNGPPIAETACAAVPPTQPSTEVTFCVTPIRVPSLNKYRVDSEVVQTGVKQTEIVDRLVP